MASKNKIYTVHAYRWGNIECHSYIVGVFSKKKKAMDVASSHEEYRGGKYRCQVYEFSPDTGDGQEIEPERKLIVPLIERNIC